MACHKEKIRQESVQVQTSLTQCCGVHILQQRSATQQQQHKTATNAAADRHRAAGQVLSCSATDTLLIF